MLTPRPRSLPDSNRRVHSPISFQSSSAVRMSQRCRIEVQLARPVGRSRPLSWSWTSSDSHQSTSTWICQTFSSGGISMKRTKPAVSFDFALRAARKQPDRVDAFLTTAHWRVKKNYFVDEKFQEKFLPFGAGRQWIVGRGMSVESAFNIFNYSLRIRSCNGKAKSLQLKAILPVNIAQRRAIPIQ